MAVQGICTKYLAHILKVTKRPSMYHKGLQCKHVVLGVNLGSVKKSMGLTQGNPQGCRLYHGEAQKKFEGICGYPNFFEKAQNAFKEKSKRFGGRNPAQFLQHVAD